MISWANHLMAGLFALSAALQYNDPDPVGWVLIYLCAAGACFTPDRTGYVRFAPYAVGVSAAAWAALLLPEILGIIEPADLFRKMHEKGGAVEVGREVGGLSIVLAWMIVLAVTGYFRKPSPLSDGVRRK